MYPPGPQKSVCMSMTISAVFAGRRSPFQGQRYGSEVTKVVSGLDAPSACTGQLRWNARHLLVARGRPDHDAERDDVRDRVEEVAAVGYADRLHGWPDRARAAEQQ